MSSINELVFNRILKHTRHTFDKVYIEALISSISNSSSFKVFQLYEHGTVLYVLNGKIKIIIKDELYIAYSNNIIKSKENFSRLSSGQLKRINKAVSKRIALQEKEKKVDLVLKKIDEEKRKILISKNIDSRIELINKKTINLITKNENYQRRIKDKFKKINLENYTLFLRELKESYLSLNEDFLKIEKLYQKIDIHKLPLEIKEIVTENKDKLGVYRFNLKNNLIAHSQEYVKISNNFIDNILN